MNPDDLDSEDEVEVDKEKGKQAEEHHGTMTEESEEESLEDDSTDDEDGLSETAKRARQAIRNKIKAERPNVRRRRRLSKRQTSEEGSKKDAG